MDKLFSSVLKRIVIIIAIALVMVLTACLATNKVSVPNEPPEITIKSGSTEIFYVVGKNIWNGAVYDREDTFIAQKERIFNRDMPYIKNGAKITISFGKNKPDSIVLSEIILDEHGNAKWRTDEHVKTYEVDFPPFGSTGTFTIEPNYATTLSSHSADHEAGNTIKGYRMICSWGKNECEYAFVILGDPAITMSTEPSETDAPNIGPSTVSPDTLNRLYLGMPRSEVESILGKRDGEGSGLDFWFYNDVGSIYFGSTFCEDSAMYNYGEAIATQINTKDKSWDIYELVSMAVKRHNVSDVPTGEFPTESHINLALDATADGFTIYVISLYETFLPGGEYNVRNVRSLHRPLALTFVKNADNDYELTEYWHPKDGSEYLSSIKAKFPEETWNKLDTQPYIEGQKEICKDDAMYFFVGAIRGTGRYGLDSGTVVVTDRASDTVEGECFVIKYFPGAQIQIDGNELHEPDEHYIIRYTDSSKNIAISKKSIEVPITEDLIGIFNTKTNEYRMKFELYTRDE